MKRTHPLVVDASVPGVNHAVLVGAEEIIVEVLRAGRVAVVLVRDTLSHRQFLQVQTWAEREFGERAA